VVERHEHRVQARGSRLPAAAAGGIDRALADCLGVAGGHAEAVAGEGLAQRRPGGAQLHRRGVGTAQPLGQREGAFGLGAVGEEPAWLPASGLAGLGHRGQQLGAGLLAAPAGLGAHPAMLMHPCVPLALVPTAVAGRHARLQLRPGKVGVVVGLAAEDPQRGGADVGAVQAQPDALDQLGDIPLDEAVVGAGGAACAQSDSASMVAARTWASRLNSRG
jgi:hypothetical protein